MAIYHLHAQIISRKTGRSAVACAAYRSGERLRDEHYDKEHDYTHKEHIRESYILAPEGAPEWVMEREQLWNQVEAAEKRVDAQLSRELDIALPSGLDQEQQKALIDSFVREEFVQRGMVADVSIHEGAKGNHPNPHAHVMLTMREIGAEGFGLKVREWNDRSLMDEVRAEWAKSANKHMELAGLEDRIDHRTLQAQGIDREPTTHQGVWQTQEVRQIERQLKAIEKMKEAERGQGDRDQVDRAGGADRGAGEQGAEGPGSGRGRGAEDRPATRERPAPSSVADVERELRRAREAGRVDLEREGGEPPKKQRQPKREHPDRSKEHPDRSKDRDSELER